MSVVQLASGDFFGGASRSHSSHGIEVSHRLAEGPAESVPTHTHEDAHFILVTAGEYVTAASGAVTHDWPALIYNPPGTTHRDHFERGRGSFFAISMAPEMARAALSAISAPSEPSRVLDRRQHALTIAIAGCTKDDGGLTLEALCFELLGGLDTKPMRASRAPPSWLRSALEMLDDRYANEVTVAEIAALVGVHPIHLARTFRHHLRCTPGEYARFRRLEKALALLAGTPQPLAQVALCCGFADQSHLSRTFTRCIGVSPREYRASAGIETSVATRAGRTFRIDKTRSQRLHRLGAWADGVRAQARRRG